MLKFNLKVKPNITKIICLLALVAIATTLLLLRPSQENLIPYETAITLPCKGMISQLNPMPPSSRNGPFPSNRNMLP